MRVLRGRAGRGLLLLLPLLLAACGVLPTPGEKSVRKKMIIDAELGYSLTLPLGWQKRTLSARHPWQARLQRWEEPAPAGARAARVEVARFRPEEIGGGFARFAELLRQGYPDLTLEPGEPDPDGEAPGWRLAGESPEAAYEIRLVTTRTRAFALLFSAPAEAFAAQEKIRAAILDSFAPLPR